MIDQLDLALRAFIADAVGDVVVDFRAPTAAWVAEWSATARPSTISCVLVRVAEDLERRVAEWSDVRDGGRVTGYQPPPRQFRLHYVVSAWADDVGVEHGIIGALLAGFVPVHAIPTEHVPSGLVGDPVTVEIALPVAEPLGPTVAFWASLGAPPRATVDLVAGLTLHGPVDHTVAPPAESLTLTARRQVGEEGRGTVSAGSASDGRRWTAVRLHESVRSDDSGLDGVRDGV